jgi:hypothetical protein
LDFYFLQLDLQMDSEVSLNLHTLVGVHSYILCLSTHDQVEHSTHDQVEHLGLHLLDLRISTHDQVNKNYSVEARKYSQVTTK